MGINLTPHGTVFDSCVTIEVPYTYTNSYLGGTLLKAADTDSDFDVVSDATYADNEDGTGTATACLSRFRTLQVVESLNPSPPPPPSPPPAPPPSPPSPLPASLPSPFLLPLLPPSSPLISSP